MLANFSFKFDSPIVCTAIHNGHKVSEAVRNNLAVSEDIQLYEEDPFTDDFTKICNNRIITKTSRFEVDLNRNADRCVYIEPKDSWGIKVRKQKPSAQIIEESKRKYFEFYRETEKYFRKMEDKFGRFFVWDIHSYNHHRNGADAPFDDPETNQDIMLGISNMNPKWFGLVQKIKVIFENYDFFGRRLTVTTQGKFPGGNFPRWIHNTFPKSACCIALEFKKIFMDEWTGKLFVEKQEKLIKMLDSVSELIEQELAKQK
ncbi:MAG: N-formylglutamate amidohydrolase [Candidatus Cloacimonetes bacterium]|nr:N-formylglutamate amidohydrolase [Candidatus Cloacimonadota bacterium]MCF7815329.1 N-formylglutamate amidohydrolase [Candidatus Cloacimonadota bacterium]MCF7869119.1 N-formylglutamate amidohydrolase [Candidatus Cloacimonadota bacterium]MCF7884544.1 N-formylglutamate amidohydrolase [Candidatus Cloacimonadota bacterium]